jgi:hypothetical protein
MFDSKDKESIVITDETRADIDGAKWNKQLSYMGHNTQLDAFEGTIDKLIFKDLNDLVTKVLEANGYVLNIENMLACLDQFKIGVRTALNDNQEEGEGPIKIKHYMPCVQFFLPSKKSSGKLLSVFYREIEAYEAKITDLEKSKTRRPKSQADDPLTLKRENQELRQEINALRHKIKELSRELHGMKRSNDQASRTIEVQKLLPPNIRTGSVRSIDLDKRSVLVKSGRTSINVLLKDLGGIPHLNAKCLVRIVEGQVTGAFLYEKPAEPFTKRIADVLFYSKEGLKVRDQLRNDWVVSAKKLEQMGIKEIFVRHERVLLKIHSTRLISIESLARVNEDLFTEITFEQIAKGQLNAHYGEAQLVNVDSKKDVA